MLDDAIWDLVDKTDLQTKERNKIDLHIFDQSVGYVEDKQKFIERVQTKIEVGADFFKPFIQVLKEKHLIELLESNFHKELRGPLVQKSHFQNIIERTLQYEYSWFSSFLL